MAEELDDEAPGEQEAKPRVYKGYDTTIGELVASNNTGVPVQFIQTEYEGARRKNAWDYGAPKTKLARIGVFSKSTPSMYAGHQQLTYMRAKDLTIQYANLPNDFPVRVLTGRLRDSLLARMDDYTLDHLMWTIARGKCHVGSDPEVFVENGSGEVIPAFKFLPSKKNPERFGGLFGNNNLYWDGYQAEFTTEPSTCIAYHADSVQSGLRGILAAAQRFDASARLSVRSVVQIPQEDLDTAADEHVEFGCMPSLNAHGIRAEHHDGRRTPFRFAGGHVHMGIGRREPEQYIRIIKAMDALLALPWVSLFAEFDNPVRRQFYGQPGEYRLPPHGFEYRVLSNAWLMHPALMHLTFDTARLAMWFGEANLMRHFRCPEDRVVDIVLRSDVDGARAVMRDNARLFNSLYSGQYGNRGEITMRVITEGAAAFLKDPADFARAWHFGPWKGHSESPNCTWGRAAETLARGEKL